MTELTAEKALCIADPLIPYGEEYTQKRSDVVNKVARAMLQVAMDTHQEDAKARCEGCRAENFNFCTIGGLLHHLSQVAWAEDFVCHAQHEQRRIAELKREMEKLNV